MQDGITPDRLHDHERVHLERIRLATQILLELGQDDLINGALEAELGILKDRAELALMLPEHAAADLMPWRQAAADLAGRISTDPITQQDDTAS